ncbi:MAG: bifunctional demethylmenaquinone methyltransferase/2-methoxy-6-polyprenyl-1,4-benzoquinol methylase UbiE [Spirulina sp. DLM2.Bin59]|nr:MAG: bifunctional demethylmenaquinone methyltransferase/2-methoxy-6-polyprenyl-1,4-benzoquinol methylase UbiE [Spirulina sp. DLM2.Bin59]
MVQTPEADAVQALFNRIAPVYDDLNHQLSWGLHRVWKKMAVKWAAPHRGDRALDLCCGSGDLAFLLAEEVGPGGEVVGVDFSVAQLAVAAKRGGDGYPQITWQEGDALAIPACDDQFDCATLAYGLRNVTDIPRCLAELHRVLKPGGRVAILDFHRPQNPWIQQFQTWYLDQVVLPTATAFDLKEDYAYIAPSVERFPTGAEQICLARAAGFAQATHYPIFGGMMGVLVAQAAADNR